MLFLTANKHSGIKDFITRMTIVSFFVYICTTNGDVAQMARVLDWQSRGRGFEPHLLHRITSKVNRNP